MRKLAFAYQLTGTLNPDATGIYSYQGQYGGDDFFYEKDQGYYLWRDVGGGKWNITLVLGTLGTAYWQTASATPAGDYDPLGTATGIGTLALYG